jgi:hypothetical protein
MLFCLAVLALLPSVFGGVSHVFGVDGSEAEREIDTARGAIVAGYNAVADAEKAGANVTGLLVRLDDAGDSLSKADLAYSKGDYDGAAGFAVQCQNRLSGFVGEASVLKQRGAEQRYWDFMINVVGSLVGVVAVVCGSIVVWVFLSKRYAKTGSAVV